MVGAQIRRFRIKKRISVSDLARRAGVSKSLISQLERGNVNPSIETVRAIASALEVPTFTLFLEQDDNHGTLVRKDQRLLLEVPGSQIVRELLTPNLDRAMLLVIGKVPPHTSSSPSPTTHRGEEAVYVLRGQLDVQLQDELHSMDAGDTLYFDARVPHLFTNPGDTEAEILSVIAPPSV